MFIYKINEYILNFFINQQSHGSSNYVSKQLTHYKFNKKIPN